MRVTMSDVAGLAGVHPSTVSRALAGNDHIPVETRQRVCQAAEKLGYRPDPFLAALMMARRSGREVKLQANLGFIVYERSHATGRFAGWMYEVYEGAQRFAFEKGFSLELFRLGDWNLKQGAFWRVLKAKNIQGVILSPEHEAPAPFELPWEELAVVSLHRGDSRTTPRFHQVVSNHFHSMLEVCREGKKAGYRRLGLILRDRHDTHPEYGRLVYGAFYAGVAEAAEEERVPPLLVRELDPDAIANWIVAERPDLVLFAGGGFSTPASLAGLLERVRLLCGLEVHRDFNVVLMCNPETSLFRSVDERTDMIGAIAMELLIDQVKKNARGAPAEPLVHEISAVFHRDPLPQAASLREAGAPSLLC